MLYGYIGCAVCLAAIFMIPSEWGESARYAYFFLAYTMLNAVFFTANNVAYATLTALITKNTSERVQLGCIRFMFAFATTMIIQGITMDAVANLGGGASAWKRVAVIFAILGLVANTLSTFSIKEMQPEELYKTDWEEDQIQIRSYTLTEGVKLLLSNKYYLMICGICFLSQLSQSALNMGVYYMKYVLGDEGMLKSFSLFANVPLILGLVVTPWFVKKLRGMYKLNIAGYVLAVLGRIGVMISAYTGSIPGMLAFTAVAALGSTPLQGGMNALIASCSEYTFLSQKTRIDGTMYSCSSFGIKLGASVGTAISGFLMASSGYVENAAVQTSGTISMLHFLYLWLPIVLNIGITYLLTRLHVVISPPTAQSKGKYLYYERYYYGAFMLDQRGAGVYAHLGAAPSLGSLTVASVAGTSAAGDTVVTASGKGIFGTGAPVEGLKLVYSINDAAVTLTYNAAPDSTKTWADMTNGAVIAGQTAGKYITVALVNAETGKVVAGGNTTLVVKA